MLCEGDFTPPLYATPSSTVPRYSSLSCFPSSLQTPNKHIFPPLQSSVACAPAVPYPMTSFLPLCPIPTVSSVCGNGQVQLLGNGSFGNAAMGVNASGRTARSAPCRAASRSRSFSEQLNASEMVTIPSQELLRLQERLKTQDGTLTLMRSQLRDSRAPSSSRLLDLANQQTSKRTAAPPYESAKPLKEVQEAEVSQRLLDLSTEVTQHRLEVQQLRQQLEASQVEHGKRSLRIWVMETSNFHGDWPRGQGIYLCFSVAQLAETTSCRPVEATVQWNEEVTFELSTALTDVAVQVLDGDTRHTLGVATIDASVLQGLGAGAVQHHLVARSAGLERDVEVTLVIEELCPQCMRPLGALANTMGGEHLSRSELAPESSPAVARYSQQEPFAADGRLELALKALRDNEPNLMKLVNDNLLDRGVLADFQNLHEALWRLQGVPLVERGGRQQDQTVNKANTALEAELHGAHLQLRQYEGDVRRLQEEHGVEIQTLEKTVAQLHRVVAEQTSGMQNTLEANANLQEEVGRLQSLLQQQQWDAQALLSDEMVQRTATMEADIVQLKKELEAGRRLDSSKDLELSSLRALLSVRDASADVLAKQLQATEAQVGPLHQEVLRLEQELQKRDTEAASQGQGAPPQEGNATTVTDPATQQRLLEAMADLARARQQMSTMEDELVRASGEIRSLREALLLVKRRPSKERDSVFPFFGLELADGVRFARGLAGTFKYGSIKVVQAWGPAADAGVQPLDFIKVVNGRPVSSLAEMRRFSLQVLPGSVVELVVERGETDLQLTVKTLPSHVVPGSHVRTNVVLARVIHKEDGEQGRTSPSTSPGQPEHGNRTFFT
eukprot:GGOE01001893.1.p1 GENE.GGOE01001893.1~~GGOE01001893.1.p1  ORF type:complete len:841 (-),score=192.41 GGOE01001893.1:226-2748(-)